MGSLLWNHVVSLLRPLCPAVRDHAPSYPRALADGLIQSQKLRVFAGKMDVVKAMSTGSQNIRWWLYKEKSYEYLIRTGNLLGNCE